MKKTQKLRSYIALTFVAVLSFTILFAATKPELAYAATNYSGLSIRKKAEAWVMGRAVSECINNNGFETNNKRESDINDKGQWLWTKAGSDGSTNIGEWAADITEGESDDSRANCATAAKKTLELMGMSGVDAICKMNDLAQKEIWKRENNGGDCKSGATDLDFDEDNNDKKDTNIWNRLFRDWLGSDVEKALTNEMRYVIYSENFYQECSEDHGEGWGDAREWKSGDKESDRIYKLNWNLNRTDGNNGGADREWYVVSGGNEKNLTVHIDGYGQLFQDDTATCRQLAERINDHADDYFTELKKAQEAGTSPNSSDSSEGGDSNSASTEPTCDSEGGPGAWVLCIVIDVIDKFISILDTQIKSLLYLDRDVYDNETVTEAWKTMRNLALLILVPMMMFMVIGTALNFGPFDPYTVKKALPRMFIAVIFIVISLPITQFGVQLSNAVGQGLGNMIINAAPDSVQTLKDIFKDSGGGTQESLGWTAIVAGLGAFAVGGAGALISFGLVAAVGLLIGFCILILRQVLIILLLVIAPLAILAWIFPGNDKLWGLWKGTFIAMLLMFPIISMLLASGKFVAGILGG